MKKVFFMSRHNAKQHKFDPNNDCLISINDTEGHKQEMLDTHDYMGNNILALVFSDIPYFDDSAISDNQVEDVFNFIESQRKKKNFYVHCLFGVSRSAAVAKYIGEYFLIDNVFLEEYDMHNIFVYKKLTEFQ